jgi:hypothetical protein
MSNPPTLAPFNVKTGKFTTPGVSMPSMPAPVLCCGQKVDGPAKPKFLRVRCNAPQALHKFITDLKEARDCCKDSGGNYSAFLILSDGRKLQVEIAFPGRI